MFITLGLFVSTTAWSANPADLTVLYRVFPAQFYGFVHDGQMDFVWANQGFGKKTSVSLTEYRFQPSGHFQTELATARALTPHIQVAGSWLSDQGLNYRLDRSFLDLSAKRYGLAISRSSNGQLAFGPRLGLTGHYTLVATIGEHRRPFWGISHSDRLASIDLAVGKGQFHLRLGRRVTSSTRLELRYKRVGGQNYIGFMVGYLK